MITDSIAIIAIMLAIILFVPMVCRKVRIPGIVGFILMGILIGPYGFELIGPSVAIRALGKMGMLYIMLQAGIEIDINDFAQHRRNAVIYGFYSFLFPFALGLLTSRLLGYDWTTCTLLGAMYGSHTLMTYPIVNRYGVQKNAAVNIAVGGTMLTITLSLLVLAILKSNFIYTDSMTVGALLGRIALFIALVIGLFPWLAKRFFKRWNDPTSGFLVVMLLMSLSAYIADWAGLEGILGAFVCGVALNRLVPNRSPLMQRISFVGNNIFVPLFLIGVGMMINIQVIWSGWLTLILALVMIATKLVGKWLASWLAQFSFGMQAVERQLMFGLTHATAAGTLAIVTIGYETGIFDDAILNAAVIMILILCTTASFVTEYAAKQLALQEEARLEADKTDDSWRVMSVNEHRLGELEELSSLSELHASYSCEAEWSDVKQLLASNGTASIVYHPAQPINTVSRMLVAVPRYAEKEHDFISCFGLVRRLSSQIGAKVIFFANKDTQDALQTFCRRKGKYLQASYREMEDWEDVLMIAKQMRRDDMIVMIAARPSTPSYNPLFEQIPDMLDRFFDDHSYLLVLPEQEAGRKATDILHNDQTPASATWSVITRIKKFVKSGVEKFQTRSK
ncbi:MAG: cation:proton antiporter [Paludibacteraceae bacterium]|nr:cation:proton antiporter [Paludibacteraceae bacterium]